MQTLVAVKKEKEKICLIDSTTNQHLYHAAKVTDSTSPVKGLYFVLILCLSVTLFHHEQILSCDIFWDFCNWIFPFKSMTVGFGQLHRLSQHTEAQMQNHAAQLPKQTKP